MIRQIRMKNCQSWEDITFDLSTDRLNVIVAENDTGKSVLFKMLKILASPKYYSRDDRKNLIRFGCEYAMVAVALDSGNVIVAFVWPNYVTYQYLLADGTKYSLTEPTQEMLNELGLLVGKDNKFIVNIIDADQDLLLVNSNLASNFALIRLIVMNDDLDNIQEKIAALQSEFSDYYVRVADQKNILERQIGGMDYYDIPKMEDSLKKAEVAYSTLKLLINIWQQAERLNVAGWKNYRLLQDLVAYGEVLCSVRGYCSSVGVSRKPVDGRFLSSLMVLSEITAQLPNLRVVKSPISRKLIEAFELLQETAALVGDVFCVYRDYAIVDSVLSALEPLEEILSFVGMFRHALREGGLAFEKVEGLHSEFLSRGRRVDCPIYGEVVYDGRECVADRQ